MNFHDYYYGLQTGAMTIGMLWLLSSKQPKLLIYIFTFGLLLDLIADLGAFGLI